MICLLQVVRAGGQANGSPGYATGATTIGPSGDFQASPVLHAPNGNRRTSSVPEERQRRFYVFFATAAFCIRPLYLSEHVLFHVVHGQYPQAMTLCQRHKRCASRCRRRYAFFIRLAHFGQTTVGCELKGCAEACTP